MVPLDVAIIGGGPAGLSAAVKLNEIGIKNILIIERNKELGGILNQCIHNGFGLHIFKEELTGPEFASKFIEIVKEQNIPFKLNTMVTNITPDKVITAVNETGVIKYKAKAVILAMGCRERPRGAINIPGSRPAGIFTAGTAQEFVNMRGYMPGKEIVILGSGDIGLIMARRMTYEGCKVKCVVELMSYSGGLKRNIAQCLNDYSIPIKYSHTISKIEGRERVEGVYISAVDQNRNPIPETEEFVKCDTILLSVGLIPENELSKKAGVTLSNITGGAIVDNYLETSAEGVFACGNVLHVHDLADNVTLESYDAAKNAAKFLDCAKKQKNCIPITTGYGVRYTVPNSFDTNADDELAEIKFRTDDVYKNCYVTCYFDNDLKFKKKRRICTPGEMEIISLSQKELCDVNNYKNITVKIETGDLSE